MKNITVLDHSIIPLKNYKNAESLCHDIDVDDTVFVALSDFTKGQLWTDDLKLQNGWSKKALRTS